MKVLQLLFAAIAVNSSIAIALTPDVENDWALSPSVDKVNLGSLLQGQTREVTINLNNTAVTGNQLIRKISKSCNCFDTAVSRDSIPPGGSATLTMKVVASGLANNLREEIIIEYMNSVKGNIGIIRIPIYGSVKSVLHLDPKIIEFEGTPSQFTNFMGRINFIPGAKFSEIKRLSISNSDGLLSIARPDHSKEKIGSFVEIRVNHEKLQFGRNRAAVVVEGYDNMDKMLVKENVACDLFLEPPFSVEPPSFLVSDIEVGSSKKFNFQIALQTSELRFEDLRVSSSDPTVIKIESAKAISGSRMDVSFTYFRTDDGGRKDSIDIQVVSGRKGNFRIPIIALNVH